MAQPQFSDNDSPRQSEYWMRAISFAGLHRMLKAVADFPARGLKAGEMNELVKENDILLTQRGSAPAPTTLYHYRNTLLHLRALKRDGRLLRVNDDDPDVYKLLCQPAPAKGDQLLSDAARDQFSVLVLKNEQCRSLFLDLFMPLGTSADSVSNFRQNGVSVTWTRCHSSRTREIVFENNKTGRTARYMSPVSVAAVPYGLRYWARDELKLIDEYYQRADGSITMFPVSVAHTFAPENHAAVWQMLRFLVSLRDPGEWTLFSIFDLVGRCCEERRQPISVLFSAINWLIREWPHHTVLIPTSRSLATITEASLKRQNLVLKGYYKTSNGPYISHIRIHKDLTIEPMELTDHHAQRQSNTQA